jgi:hypothetical protein
MSRINCRKCNLINFASDFNCRRCGNELYPGKSGNSGFSISLVSLFPFLFKILLVAVVGGICYLGYTTYLEESEKVAKESIRIREEKEKMKSAYVDSIKKEVRKIQTPTP